ncbi:MAG: 3-dehydroquinate synthase family protein, partial [Pseudomonadota bacterium]
GKNLIGTFHQPSLVLADITTLATLPEREMRAGYAEVLKYGLLGDAAFFDWLEGAGDDVLALDETALMVAIEKSVLAKADVVIEDEHEAGRRALLNLGHTFGHALEAATGYSQRLLHGEGVAIGMAMAFRLSAQLGLCDGGQADRLQAHLKARGLLSDLSVFARSELPDVNDFIGLMGQDKKVRKGRLHFILARDIGAAFVTDDVPNDVLADFLDKELQLARA